MKKKESLKDKIKRYWQEVRAHPLKWLSIVLGTVVLAGILNMCLEYILKLPKITRGEVDSPFNFNPINIIKEGIFSIGGWVMIILIICIGSYCYEFLIKPRIKIEEGDWDEERGIRVRSKIAGTYGTSVLVTDPKELGDIIDVKPLKETTGIILGKPLSADTTKIKKDTDVSIKEKTEVISLCSDDEYFKKSNDRNWNIDDIVNNKLNKNIAVFGASGTMKSRALARNFIMQDAIRGESIIVTDPKGELYEDTAEYLRQKGYYVKMFNLTNQKCSDSWNCLAELLDKDGKVDSTNAKIFADTIVQNASGNGKDDYWSQNACNLLKAVCLLVAEDENLSDEQKNMGTVYDLISGTREDLEARFENVDSNSVASRSYRIFKSCNEVVQGQIMNGLGIMISVFQDDAIRNITSSIELDLSKPATEKCAYFCITSDQHKVFDFIAVLFYAMLFIKLVDKVDSARTEHEKTIPINLVLDEFPNIGQIPDFCKKISTVRSRNINITIIFQNIAQLQNRYPNNQWEEILGNCDTTVFLGCTDDTTAEYISKKTGIQTIEVTTQNTKYERDVMIFNQNTSYNEVKSSGQRKVLNPDEVLKLKNTEELLLFRGRDVVKAKKFDYTLHPESCKLISTVITEHVPEWKRIKMEEERIAKEEKERIRRESERKEQERLEQAERDRKQAEEDRLKEEEEIRENSLNIFSQGVGLPFNFKPEKAE